jgi:diguanylate cyclase (GGDEF)-like protein
MAVSTSSTTLYLEALVDCREVPTPPAAALRILELRSDPDSGVRELAEVVESDPALVLKILSTANSAFYSRGNEVTSVERAISLMGRNSVITITLAFSVASSIPADGTISGVSMAAYWNHSIITAAAARALAAEVAPGLGGEAFLIGLISGMGRVVLALAAGPEYQPVAEANDGWPSYEAERASIGLSSAAVSAQLLRSWAMPASLCAAIEAIEDPSSAEDEEVRQLASIARVAQSIAKFYLDEGDAADLRDLISDATANNVPGDALDAVLDSIREHVSDVAAQLNLNVSADDYAATIAKARSQLVEQALQTNEMWHQERDQRERLEQTQATYEAEARRDPLTGLANRRAFSEQMELQLSFRLRAETVIHKPMGVIMIDVDHFKSVNDTHGHDVGDQVLKQLAETLGGSTRDDETMARFGGEEFVLLAPMANQEQLAIAAERFRQSIEDIEIPLPGGETLRITASFGVATLQTPESVDDGDKLLKAADEALYEAKAGGRNRVVLSTKNLG